MKKLSNVEAKLKIAFLRKTGVNLHGFQTEKLQN